MYKKEYCIRVYKVRGLVCYQLFEIDGLLVDIFVVFFIIYEDDVVFDEEELDEL